MADERLTIQILAKDAASRSLGAVKRGITGLGKAATSTTGAFRGMHNQLAAVAALFTTGTFINSALSTFAQFDDTMRQVGAVTGATTDQMILMTDVAKEMGRTTRFSASEAADGLRLMGMAGFEAAEATEALPGVLNLAAAGTVDLATAADIATNVLTGFGLEVERLGRVNDVLVSTFTSSNTTIQELGVAFSYVGPIAKGVGADFEDLFAALGKLGDAGIKASMAGTTLRGVFDALLNPTTQESKAIASLTERLGGVSLQVKDAQGNFIGFQKVVEQLEKAGLRGEEALRIFGLRAGPGMAALINIGSDSLDELGDKIRTTGGITDRIAGEMEAGIGGAMRESAAAFEAVKIALIDAFGEHAIKAIRGVRDWLVDLVDTIKQLKEDGTIDAWAKAAEGALNIVSESLRVVWTATQDVVRGFLFLFFALEGNVAAAEAAFADLGKEARAYREEMAKIKQESLSVTLPIQAMKQGVESMWVTMDNTTKRIGEALGKDGPIGRGIKEVNEEGKKVKIIDEVSALQQLKSSLVKIRASLDLEGAKIESSYSQGLIQLDQYFAEREILVRRRVSAEIEILQELANEQASLDKKAQINAQIFALQQSLNQSLIELDNERFLEQERLDKDRLKKEQDINKLRLNAEEAMTEQRKRVQPTGDNLQQEFMEELIALEMKHSNELMEIEKFYTAEIALMEERNASEQQLLEVQEEFKRTQQEQTALQQIELDEKVKDQQIRANELRLQNTKKVTGGMAEMFANMYTLTGKKNKELFYLSKAAAIAQATMNVAEGFTKALSQGGFYGIIMGAVVAAAGAVQIATIANQSLATGGLVNGHSPTSTADNIPINATAGEFMHPVSSVDQLGIDAMEIIRRGAFNADAVRGALGLGGFSSPTVKYGHGGFAQGGAVTADSGLDKFESRAQKGEKQTNIINVLDPAVMQQWSASTPGQQNIMNVISENIFTVRQLVFDNQQG